MQRALSRIFHQTCARSFRDSAVTLFVDFAHAVLFGLCWHPAGLVRTARLTLTCVPEALRAPLGSRVGLVRAGLRLHVSSTAASTASAFGSTASTAFRRVLLRFRTLVRVMSHLAAVEAFDVLVRRWSASTASPNRSCTICSARVIVSVKRLYPPSPASHPPRINTRLVGSFSKMGSTSYYMADNFASSRGAFTHFL